MSKRPTIPAKVKLDVALRQALCFYCGEILVPSTKGVVEFDHIKARALGGSDGGHNLVASHHECHRHKTDVDLGKIASEKRREKKRTRAGEKRALEKLAKQADLQKLIVRGSDLLPVGDEDVGADGSGIASSKRSRVPANKKAWPKTSFPKRQLRSARASVRKAGAGRVHSEVSHGHDQVCEGDAEA